MDDIALIKALGGTGAVARRFQVSDAAVSLWRQRGIPRSRHLQVFKVCQEEGLDWTPSRPIDAPDTDAA